MSVYISADVWKYSKTRGSARLLLLALADNAREETRIAIVGITYLAEKTRLSQRAVHRLIQELEASGEVLIERNRGRHRVNRYKINEYTPEDTPEEKVTDCQVFDDDPMCDAEFGATVKGDKSCEENMTFDAENMTFDAENMTSQEQVTVSNRLEPLIEPLVCPNWFKTLQEIKGFKTSYKKADAWRIENEISEEIATDIAYELAGHPYATDPKRNKWAVFQNWSRKRRTQPSANGENYIRNLDQQPGKFIGRQVNSGSPVDMDRFAIEIESRTSGGVTQ
jgi:DNA-binding Lrp family transcriptional regulator